MNVQDNQIFRLGIQRGTGTDFSQFQRCSFAVFFFQLSHIFYIARWFQCLRRRTDRTFCSFSQKNSYCQYYRYKNGKNSRSAVVRQGYSSLVHVKSGMSPCFQSAGKKQGKANDKGQEGGCVVMIRAESTKPGKIIQQRNLS